MTAYRSLFLHRPGAVEADGADMGVAAHYGDPMREQRVIRAGGYVDLSNRGVLKISGPDRLSWLHSMTTQQLADLGPMVSTETLVLSPHGHIEFDLHLIDDGTTTWLTTEPGSAAGLFDWLNRMKFMLRVQVDDVSDEYAVLGQASSSPATAADRDAGRMVWVDPWPALGLDTASYSNASPHPGASWEWREVLVPRTELDNFVGASPLAGTLALDALRIEAWRPRVGFETDHRTIPHELDWLRTAVHLHKGCYRGQETIARVHNLGRPPRRLVFLHLDGSEHELPAAGAELTLPGGGRPVGRITTSARHLTDGPIALAVVKRNVPVEATLQAGTVTAAQTVVVVP